MIKRYLFLLIMLISVVSCGKALYGRLYDRIEEAREGSNNYVVLKDGTKVKGIEVKRKLAGNKALKNDGVEVDGRHYKMEDIEYFQDDKALFLNYKDIIYYRLMKGRLECYLSTSTTGKGMSGPNTTQTLAYIRKDREDLYLYTPKNLYQLISDNSAAVDLFNKLYSSSTKNSIIIDAGWKKLEQVLEVYNSTANRRI